MQIMDYFVTESEAARMLRVNRNTIARWSKEGKLDVQRVGRIGLIPRWQIALLEKNNNQCPSDAS